MFAYLSFNPFQVNALFLQPLKTSENRRFLMLLGVELSLHPLPFCWGVEAPTKFSKRGGLTGHKLLEGIAGKEWVTFFREGQCSHK